MRRNLHVMPLLILAALALSGQAHGQAIPPGNSGADQYEEGVPGAGGNNSQGSGGNSDGSDGGGGLPASVVDDLQGEGSLGAQAAAALSASAPDGASRSGQGGQAQQVEANGGDSGSDGGGSLSNVVNSALAGSDDGMGPVLPIILVAAVIGAFALVVRRRASGETRPRS